MQPASLPHLPPAPGSEVPLIELWLSLKASPHTRRAYAADITRFLAFSGKPLIEATLADLAAFARHLAEQGLAVASQNRCLTALKSLLAFGHQTGYLPQNAGTALPLRPGSKGLAGRILDEQAVAQLLATAPEGRNRTLLKLLYVSGIRVSELCGLRWKDAVARPGGGQITVWGKGGKQRSIRVKAGTWEQLVALRQNAGAMDPVFASQKGGGPLDPSQVRRIVAAAARRAGIEAAVSPHWLRHAHASHALDHNAPIHLVQATLGHASIATTGRYLHARPAESSSAYLPD